MRLFVAVRPPGVAVDHADGAVAPVRARHPDLRWVPAQRWHLTLAFYGEVPEGTVDGVRAMVERRVAGAGQLRLQLAGAGEFTRRAVWLGLAGDVERLRALARSVTLERRPYRPHLTVARVRGGVDAGPAVAELAGYVGPAWTADAVHLVRSRLGPAPAYDDIATWPLQPPP